MIRKTSGSVLFWFVFIGIVLVACVLRFYRLGQVPVSLYWDEMAMYVDVKSVLQSGQDMFGRPWYQIIYPSYGDFKLPVYIWSAILSARIFGLSEWSFRLPSALAGVGTVVVAGFLARELFQSLVPKKAMQVVAMLVVACSPWSILFSRTGFEGHLGQFFLALSILCVFLSKKHSKLILLSPIFGGLATYSYFSVRFVWVIVFLSSFALLYFSSSKKLPKLSKITAQKFLLSLVAPLLIYIALLLPMMKSPLYQDANRFRLGTDSVLNKDYVVQSNVYRQLAGNSRWDRVLFNSKVLMLQELLKNYAANTSPNFLFVSGDPNLRHGTSQSGLFLISTLPFFFYGILELFNKNKALLAFLVIWWFAALLPASVPENVPHALRALNALVPLSLMIAFGITMAVVQWQAYIKLNVRSIQLTTFLKVLSSATLLILFLFPFTQFLYFYFTVYPTLSAHDWQDGYKQLAQAIYAQKTSGESVVIVPFDDRFYLWLMAYGPYTAQDFHSWKSEKYQFFTLGSEAIQFQSIDDKAVATQHHPVLVAGKLDEVTKQLVSMKTKATTITEVDGVISGEKFMLATFK